MFVKLCVWHMSNNVETMEIVMNFCIVFFVETDLHNVIKRGNVLRDIHKRYIMYQLLKATKYLHSGNVIHRDQKVYSGFFSDYFIAQLVRFCNSDYLGHSVGCNCFNADYGMSRHSPMSLSTHVKTV